MSHGGLRKGNQDCAVITGFYRSPGIAGLPISHDAEIVAEKVIDGGSPCFAEATTLTLEEAREKARPTVLDAAVQATFPKGNLYIDLRTEFGMLYDDQFFDDLYLAERLPVEVAPGAWHWSW